MRIDHVIYATTDLDAATARVCETLGAAAVGGGRHEGLGTINRIVPLGRGYVEVIAVEDPTAARDSPVAAAVHARIAAAAEGWLGWAIAVADLDAVSARLGTETTTIAREGLSARLTGFAESLTDPALPFFIERDPGVPDPAASGPESLGGIAWVEVAADAAALDRWLGGASLPLRVVPGTDGLRAVGVGDRELRG